MSLITAPGLYPGIGPRGYFAEPCPAPALTASTIKTLIEETPYDAAYAHPGLNRDPDLAKANAAMRVGDVVHQLALGKGRGYRISEHARWDRRNAEVAKFLDECERDGMTPIKANDFADAERMADIVRDRIEMELALIARKRGVKWSGKYETEVVFAWIEETASGPVWCRGMADVWCEELAFIGDPKVTAALTNSRVQGHMQKQGWPRQAAWYLRGFGACLPHLAGRLTFGNILVKPKPPYTARAVSPMEAWRTVAERECVWALNSFGRYLDTCGADYAKWPGYPEGLEMIDAPGWVLREDIEEDEDEAA